MANSLKKGMLYVLIANVINLFFNLITNFVLPKELSVENYAMIKTFQLYVSYAGLFHIGFVDDCESRKVFALLFGDGVQDIFDDPLLVSVKRNKPFVGFFGDLVESR